MGSTKALGAPERKRCVNATYGLWPTAKWYVAVSDVLHLDAPGSSAPDSSVVPPPSASERESLASRYVTFARSSKVFVGAQSIVFSIPVLLAAAAFAT